MSWLLSPVSRPNARVACVLLVLALVLPGRSLFASVPEYKLGDVATDDVVTPISIAVLDPEATEALKEKVAQQLPSIVRFTSSSVTDAEAEMRANIASTRMKFMTALQAALQDRAPIESDIGTPAYTAALEFASRDAAKNLPLEKLVPLWIRGQSDQPFTETLLDPIREVMNQPILGVNKTDPALPANPLVRLIPVKSLTEPVALSTLEAPGQTIASGKLISLWRAQRFVETRFPAGQEQLGAFAASFVRANAFYDASLTEIARAKRTASLAVNDTFEPAQIVVHKGQTIDRKTLNALAVLREKSLIGTLQSRLEQEQSVAVQIKGQTIWIAAALGLTGIVLGLIFWRLHTRPSTALIVAAPGVEGATLPGAGGNDSWKNRALEAERKAERAFDAIRSGVLGWMREKIFRTLFRQRAELLSAQQRAEGDMRELEHRLEKLHTPLQERLTTYEKRIAELEKELAAKASAAEPAQAVIPAGSGADRVIRHMELTLAERERALGEREILLAERVRDLAEMDALLRAREALLSSTRLRNSSKGRVTVRGIDSLNNN